MKKQAWLPLLLMVALVVGACSGGESNPDDPRDLAEEPYQREEFLLGTLVTIQVFDEGQEEAANLAMERVADLDGRFSMTNESSEIYKVNENAGQEPVEVSEEVFYVLEESLAYAEISEGGFDPTVGALTALWGFGHEDASVPSEEEINQVLPLVDYQKVDLNAENQTVYLQEEGMKLDLGGVAKGFITDEAARVLQDQGVTTALADLGGDIYVIGPSTRGIDEPWRIGIQDPFKGRGEIIGIAPVQDEAIVTSGIYERTVEEGDRQYHHLIDPETGYPFENEIAGLSLVANSAMVGDALATSVFSMGVEEGLEFVNNDESLEAIFITREREIYLSSGYEDEFQITNEDEFTVMN